MNRKIKVSVIIPARNEEEYIGECIKSIKNQDFRNYEIIVVDNGSADATAEIAVSLGAKVIFEPEPGLPKARETGLRAASGELLVYFDADTIVPPDYLSRLVSIFRTNKKVVAVSNPFKFYDGDFIGDIILKIYFRIHIILYRCNLMNFVFGGNFGIRREVVDKIGGFDENIKFYGEDTNLSKRVSKEGKIAFVRNLYTLTSARRYRSEGTIKTLFLYFANHLCMRYLNEPFSLPNFNITPVLRYSTITFASLLIFVYALAYPKSKLFGKVIYKIDSQNKAIALTFDDGPNGRYTEEVLNVLDRDSVKATFFLIGRNVEIYPGVAREIVRRGYNIGNHSYTHPWKLPFETPKTVRDEVNMAEELIYDATKVHTKLFRPPHGLRTPWMIDAIRDEGYTIVTWDDMTTDYMKNMGPEKIAKNILAKVHPGSIIVLHDGVNLNHKVSRDNTIIALNIIIKELKKEGYTFKMLDENGTENNIIALSF